MIREKSDAETKKLVDVIIEGIKEKKGKNIIDIDLSELANSACKHFVVCHADSNTQVGAIVGSVEDFVKKELKENVWKKEGLGNSQWVLLDFSSVVVHVFQTEFRSFYNLEGLWADAKFNMIESEK